MASCTGQPVSWLRLERVALGADDAAARAHLEACPACRACLDHIAADRVVLPPLPSRARAPARPRWRFALPAFATAVLALALLLVVVRGRDRQPTLARVKGDATVVLAVIRDRAGAIDLEPRDFAPADRFEVVLTCASAEPLDGEIVVIQDGASATPLPHVHSACGNRVVLPGAFTLDGGPAEVCFVAGARAPLAATVRRACLALAPARDGASP